MSPVILYTVYRWKMLVEGHHSIMCRRNDRQNPWAWTARNLLANTPNVYFTPRLGHPWYKSVRRGRGY